VYHKMLKAYVFQMKYTYYLSKQKHIRKSILSIQTKNLLNTFLSIQAKKLLNELYTLAFVKKNKFTKWDIHTSICSSKSILDKK